MLPAEEFDRIVESALACIPGRFRRRMQNVAIIVEEEPPQPGLLGLYQGRPLSDRSVFESISSTRALSSAQRTRSGRAGSII